MSGRGGPRRAAPLHSSVPGWRRSARPTAVHAAFQRRPFARLLLATGFVYLAALAPHSANAVGYSVPTEQLMEPPPLIFLLVDVGLAPGAVVTINVTNTYLGSSTNALVILSHREWSAWSELIASGNFQPLPGGGYGGYLVSAWRQPIKKGGVTVRHEIRAPGPDRYYVCVLNPHQDAMLLEGFIAYENPGGQHLQLQLSHVPETLLAASFSFALLALALALVLVVAYQRSASLLHALLLGVLCLKATALALEWRYWDMMSRHGAAPDWRYQAYMLVAKLHATGEVTLLLVSALGWRVLRPRLTGAELRGTFMVCSLGCSLAFFEASGALGPSMLAREVIALFFYVYKVMCYLAIIVATNFNLQLIAMHLQDSPISPAAAFLYQKQITYGSFRRIFVAVVFRPSALLWVQLSVLGADGQEAWVHEAMSQGSLWLVYAVLFLALRPGHSKRGVFDLLRVVSTGEGLGPGSDEDEDEISESVPSDPAAPVVAPSPDSLDDLESLSSTSSDEDEEPEDQALEDQLLAHLGHAEELGQAALDFNMYREGHDSYEPPMPLMTPYVRLPDSDEG